MRDAKATCAPATEMAHHGTAAATRPVKNPSGPGRLALRLAGGATLKLDRELTVGQSSLNSLVVRDECVSRRHFTIEMVERRPRLRDLGSTNGTYVNGMRVTTAELTAGASITVGSTRLVVVHEHEEETKILGQSAAMIQLRSQIDVLAATELPVLILGETGTGKELVAMALHARSGRKGAFIPLNCGSIPHELVESELFGHEKGAFTGASTRRDGVFQEADGGTLFLDEIGELPLALQSRLLRALESGVIRPVGANRELQVRVRVVAATHVDLNRGVSNGAFRQDLFYRLAGSILRTPPLRERVKDIPELVQKILEEVDPTCRVAETAMEAILKHDWPGNVRELKNVLRTAATLHGPLILPEHLLLRQAGPLDGCEDEVVRLDGRPYLEIERDVLQKTLQRHRGNKRAAANALQIPKSTLCDKARRYGITGK